MHRRPSLLHLRGRDQVVDGLPRLHRASPLACLRGWVALDAARSAVIAHRERANTRLAKQTRRRTVDRGDCDFRVKTKPNPCPSPTNFDRSHDEAARLTRCARTDASTRARGRLLRMSEARATRARARAALRLVRESPRDVSLRRSRRFVREPGSRGPGRPPAGAASSRRRLPSLPTVKPPAPRRSPPASSPPSSAARPRMTGRT